MVRRGYRRDEAGSTAVELAFCLPILLMLVLGVVQFGWAQHQVSSIRYALQRSSRALMINPDLTEAQLQTQVSSRLVPAAGIDVDISLTKTTTAYGRLATIGATYVANFGVPMVGQFNIPFQVNVNTALPPI
jgi:Flp pilus assembly protein TadG